jgi:hypothetical protein
MNPRAGAQKEHKLVGLCKKYEAKRAKMGPSAAKRAKTGPRRGQEGAKKGQEGQDEAKMKPR